MLCAEDVCRCFVQKSLQWHEQNQPKTTQSVENTSPFLVPAQFSVPLCFLMPRGARGWPCVFSSRITPDLLARPSSARAPRTGTGWDISHVTQSHPMGCLRRCSWLLIWRGTSPFPRFWLLLAKYKWNWKQQSTIPAGSLWELRGTN